MKMYTDSKVTFRLREVHPEQGTFGHTFKSLFILVVPYHPYLHFFYNLHFFRLI